MVFYAVKDIRLYHHLLLIPPMSDLHPSDPYHSQRSQKKPNNAPPQNDNSQSIPDQNA